MKKHSIPYLFIASFLLLGGIYLISLIKIAPITTVPHMINLPPTSSSEKELKSYWASRINLIGGTNAYKEFKAVYAKVQPGEVHPIAHIFGTLLYQKEGRKGITVCDTNFGFGCYHGFFISAISEKGPTIVNDLYNTCVTTYGILGTGCQHGIGHGVAEYYGHTNIVKAINLCGSIQNNLLLGCSSGVFMEYNFPLNETIAIRTPKDDPYFPCTKITNQFISSCYFELARKWVYIYPTDAEKLQLLCTNIPSSVSNTHICLKGIGSNIGEITNYDMSKSLAICDKMIHSNSIFCKAGVAWSFFADVKYRNKSSEACSDFDNLEKAMCIKESDLTKDSI